MNLSKEQQLIILGLVVSILIGLAVSGYRHFFGDLNSKIIIEEPKSFSAEAISQLPVMVHLAGAVKREGVYKVKSGDRLIDLLNLAGGVSLLADLSAVNLAEVVRDGQKIVIPAKISRVSGDPVIGGSGTLVGNSQLSGRVNINTADERALDSLPGIGLATAKKIIQYRSENGPFTKVEQMMEVGGIGKGKFEKLKGRITI